MARSEQSPVRSGQPPKTLAAAQHLDPDGFCERDERKGVESVGGTVGGWRRWWVVPVCGWRRWVLGEMEWWVREGMGWVVTCERKLRRRDTMRGRDSVRVIRI